MGLSSVIDTLIAASKTTSQARGETRFWFFFWVSDSSTLVVSSLGLTEEEEAMEDSSQGSFVTTINEDYESVCWGCGLNLVLPSYAPVFKCGWCGAITNHNPVRPETRRFVLRRIRDRCFVAILAVFMLFVICKSSSKE